MAFNANNIIVGAASISIDAQDIGYTKGGCTVRYEPEYVDITADQAVGVVQKRRANERMYLTMTMLEVTLERIRQAFNQPAGNLTGSTLTLGYNNSCVINEHAIILTGVGPSCGARTFTFARCIAMGTREYKMSREEETAFEVEFEVLKQTNGSFGTIVDA